MDCIYTGSGLQAHIGFYFMFGTKGMWGLDLCTIKRSWVICSRTYCIRMHDEAACMEPLRAGNHIRGGS